MAAMPHDDAVRIIEKCALAHPDESLLRSFLECAFDRNRAASYLLQQYFDSCSSGSRDVLITMTEQWYQILNSLSDTRLACSPNTEHRIVDAVKSKANHVCFLTGNHGTILDPLVVVPIFPKIDGETNLLISQYPMLEAFLSPQQWDWLSKNQQTDGTHAEEFWLVQKSALSASNQGYFDITLMGTSASITKNYIGGPRFPAVVENTKPVRSTTVVSHLEQTQLEILSRLSIPTRWMHVKHQLSQPGKEVGLHHCFKPASRSWLKYSLHYLWISWAPLSVRAATYHQLANVGRYLYGCSCSVKVQRLPLGTYLKVNSVEWQYGIENEVSALNLLRQHSSIPVPEVLDHFSYGDKTYLLTSRLPGNPIGVSMDTMTDSQLGAVMQDLHVCLAQLRSLPRTNESITRSGISGVSGGPCYDYRINAGLPMNAECRSGDLTGPFATESDFFMRALRSVHFPDLKQENIHKIVFTHGDINPRNVLVDKDGKFCGIVDWENAGWYPEYWDYTKAHYMVKYLWRWLRAIDVLFMRFSDYSAEFQVERQLWEHCY